MTTRDKPNERSVRKLTLERANTKPDRAEPSAVDSVPRPDLEVLYAKELEEFKAGLRASYIEKLKQEAEESARKEFLQMKQELEEQIRSKEQLVEIELDAASAALEAVNNKCRALGEEVEQAVVNLTLECLAQLVGRADSYRELVADLVSHSLEKINADQLPVVRLCRTDFEMLADGLRSGGSCECVVDDSLTPGEISVDCKYTRYSVGFVSQLTSIESALRGCVNA